MQQCELLNQTRQLAQAQNLPTDINCIYLALGACEGVDNNNTQAQTPACYLILEAVQKQTDQCPLVTATQILAEKQGLPAKGVSCGLFELRCQGAEVQPNTTIAPACSRIPGTISLIQ